MVDITTNFVTSVACFLSRVVILMLSLYNFTHICMPHLFVLIKRTFYTYCLGTGHYIPASMSAVLFSLEPMRKWAVCVGCPAYYHRYMRHTLEVHIRMYAMNVDAYLY